MTTAIAMRTMCQSCLAPNPMTDVYGWCRVCGGECCWCGSCMDTLGLLEAGERRSMELGTQSDVERWTPQEGCQ